MSLQLRTPFCSCQRGLKMRDFLEILQCLYKIIIIKLEVCLFKIFYDIILEEDETFTAGRRQSIHS